MENNLCVSCQQATMGLHRCDRCQRPIHPKEPCCTLHNSEGSGDDAQYICALCQCAIRVQEQRKNAKRKLEEQADRMLAASKNRLQPAAVGQNVLIRIPEVDRGRADPINLMAVLINESNGFFRLGTKNGILQRMYCRSEFELCNQEFFTVDDVPQNKEISLREAVGAASVSGHGQGGIRCGCSSKARCSTNTCKCKRENMLCNSRCHNSNPCCNK